MYTIAQDLYTKTGHELIKTSYDPKNLIIEGTNFLIGNGYFGHRGTFMEDRKAQFVATIVTDTWDKADDKWEELSNVPNPLYTVLFYEGEALDLKTPQTFERQLDLKHGLFKRTLTKQVNETTLLSVEEEKFASYVHKNILAMQVTLKSNQTIKLKVKTGLDYDLWQLNGDHLKDLTPFEDTNGFGLLAKTQEKDHDLFVYRKDTLKAGELVLDEGLYSKTVEIVLKANQPYQFSVFGYITSQNDAVHPQTDMIALAQNIYDYEAEKTMHQKAWDVLWKMHDVKIKGSPQDQVALRFNLYHALIATPVHKPLPIGARGLSAQAYQGSAFWDQEIYNFPMYLFTNPLVAKNLLIYRYHTLEGAKRKAKKHGFEGAFYAWISGKTGDELCPDFFFKDVITNRPIRNHFNLWQIHISFDIAYAIHQYMLLTKDTYFMETYGIKMLVEISRFLASRVVYKPTRKRYEILQVQGPDEYHENVDNNAFTNYMAHFALEYTLLNLKNADEPKVSADEITLWQDIYQKLYLPKPHKNHLIEQFDNYFDLESIVPANKVKKRLIDDNEYYGWPNGITVYTQCLKQADVVQLFALHPTLFDVKTMQANYAYYEPRTLHFSSLSPTTHALVAARLNKKEEAYRMFKKALNIDLLNTNESFSGGTFIGGIHTANNGAAWQVVVFGFMGLHYDHEKLIIDPRMPKAYQSISTQIIYHNQPLKITVDHKTVVVENVSYNKEPIKLEIESKPYTLKEKLIHQKNRR